MNAAASRACCTTVTGGADAASGVIWRGLEFTRALSLEPWVELARGAASLDASGVWAVDGSWAEQEATAALSWSGRPGTGRVFGTAYAFPGATRDLPSPVGEVSIEYETAGPTPVRVTVSRNVAHDPEHAAAAGLGAAHTWARTSGELFTVVALNRTRYYDASAGAVLQVGAGAAREFRPARHMAFTAGIAAIYSPAHARSWLLARCSLEFDPLDAWEAPPPERPLTHSLTKSSR
ncbi:MAG: hypothetical protein KGL93_06290 [Gemmatimonadota bacterium]|nr:hypothetical protein [Gemmatimonadota bacterium]